MPEISYMHGAKIAAGIEESWAKLYHYMRLPERDRKRIHDAAATANQFKERFIAADKRKLHD